MGIHSNNRIIDFDTYYPLCANRMEIQQATTKGNPRKNGAISQSR